MNVFFSLLKDILTLFVCPARFSFRVAFKIFSRFIWQSNQIRFLKDFDIKFLKLHLQIKTSSIFVLKKSTLLFHV